MKPFPRRLFSRLLQATAVFTMVLPVVASADTGVVGKISLLQNYETHAGFLVRLDVAMPDPDGCGRTDWYILPDTATRALLSQSMLLTARSTGAQISLVIGGCYQGIPRILHITL